MIIIPGSKSSTNRALLMAALTKGAVTLHKPLYSDDTESMIGCLRTLGLHIETDPDHLIVHDDISVVQNKDHKLFAKDSGTTMRFILALLVLLPGRAYLYGNRRLEERPLLPLIASLRLLGANIECMKTEGRAPLQIVSAPLQQESRLPIDPSMSSQFLSALLMIAPFCNGITLELLRPSISESYVAMTLAMMREWGITVEERSNSFTIPSGQFYKKRDYIIESDFSSSCYFFAIAVLMKRTMRFSDLNPESMQPDRRFLAILEKMGNKIIKGHNEITVIGTEIRAIDINMEQCPDQVQTMAVLAAFAQGRTHISGVRSLRVKETDRIYALRTELSKMGIQTVEEEDSLTIYGGKPKSALIETYGDHRMAMAFAIAQKKIPSLVICNPYVVNKTFPTFWEELKKI